MDGASSDSTIGAALLRPLQGAETQSQHEGAAFPNPPGTSGEKRRSKYKHLDWGSIGPF